MAIIDSILGGYRKVRSEALEVYCSGENITHIAGVGTDVSLGESSLRQLLSSDKLALKFGVYLHPYEDAMTNFELELTITSYYPSAGDKPYQFAFGALFKGEETNEALGGQAYGGAVVLPSTVLELNTQALDSGLPPINFHVAGSFSSVINHCNDSSYEYGIAEVFFGIVNLSEENSNAK